MINTTPKRDLGAFFGELMLREQSIGECRGLQRVTNVIHGRKFELERRLNLIPEEQQPNPEY